MPFDQFQNEKPSVAVIGGGIAGLSTAWALSETAHVTVLEKDAKFGGHARTVVAGKDGGVSVDTGFIVFNFANYPHLTRLFRDLDVPIEKSNMSFGVSAEAGRIEYALSSLDTLFAQRRNAGNPAFLRMIADVVRFNQRAEAVAVSDDITVNDLIERLRLGPWFRDYYLLPMCGAIWSTPSVSVGDFPARTLVRFFKNHALMSVNGQHQWWTVTGGSWQYVSRLQNALIQRGVVMRPKADVRSVQRINGRVVLNVEGAGPQTFDHVVFASHADQTLRMLADPSKAEETALSKVRFQDNHAYLHADPSQMPVRQKCWSSWVYQSANTDRAEPQSVGVTYWMNKLQNIDPANPLFVTLNPSTPISEDLIYDQNTFRHPVFDHGALSAQKEIGNLQGERNTWFAGAWLRHGFHEDGIASGYRVARALQRSAVSRSRVDAQSLQPQPILQEVG